MADSELPARQCLQIVDLSSKPAPIRAYRLPIGSLPSQLSPVAAARATVAAPRRIFPERGCSQVFGRLAMHRHRPFLCGDCLSRLRNTRLAIGKPYQWYIARHEGGVAMSVHRCMDRSMDAGVDGRWMSYAELAEVRRIDKASALKLAIRRGWPRQKNNHGQMQVCVPLDWAQPPERLRDTATDRGMDSGVDLSTALAAYEAAQAAFATALAAKDRLVVALEATISAQAQVVAAAEIRAVALTQEAQEARQEADAERSRADLAEQTVVAERSRADAAEARVAGAAQAADQARQHAREAEDALEAMRQAEAERAGKGRWARLRAAWRGE